MLKFFSTGQNFKQETTPSRFLPQRGVVGKAGTLSTRNYVDQEKVEFKSAATTKHLQQTYSEQFNLRNIGKEKKYFDSQYSEMNQNKKRHSESQPKLVFDKNKTPAPVDTTAERNIYLKKDSNHFHNWKIQKERQFAFQSRKMDPSATQSQILNKNEYIKQRNNSDSTLKLEHGGKGYIPRENFYRTKPLLRLDNDFKDKPLIKNVQTISEDTPQWCQNTNKYYDPELVDVTKKARKQKLPPVDLFGNPLKKHENNFMFEYSVPFSGQRYEVNKMVIMDKAEMQFKRNHTIEDARKSHIKLNWKEDTKKQNYEYNMPKKIFTYDQKPYIKHLEEKRQAALPQKQKEMVPQENKDKLVQLKIGHGVPETINPVKYQPITTGTRYY